jgi:hypothetical protein
MIRIATFLSFCTRISRGSAASFCTKKVEQKSNEIVRNFTDRGIDENRDKPVTAGTPKNR